MPPYLFCLREREKLLYLFFFRNKIGSNIKIYGTQYFSDAFHNQKFCFAYVIDDTALDYVKISSINFRDIDVLKETLGMNEIFSF